MQSEEFRMQSYGVPGDILHFAFSTLHSKVALSRGFAPRTSAFAERRAELITP